jgi:hypothetical protein
MKHRPLSRILTAILLLATLAGCVVRRPPTLEPLRRLDARAPVILVPGTTGTMLRDRATGRVLWGNAWSVFFPRDGAYRLALPVTAGEGADGGVEAFAPVMGFHLLGVKRVEAYEAVARLMTANGYRQGDLESPHPDDTFFIYVYDWRYGTEYAARRLVELLERLRGVRGEATLRVTLICQSTASSIGRYAAKYGGVSLDEAETGRGGLPSGIEIDKLILVGTSNGGALRTLRELQRGRSYVPLLGRKIQPEALFTFRSLFEDLPLDERDLFVDERGEPVEIDVFDPDVWVRHAWSAFSAEAERRIARKGREDLFGTHEDRVDYLADRLESAERLGRLLAADSPHFGETRYYSLQNAYTPTPRRAVVTGEGDAAGTWYATDRWVRRDPLLRLLAAAPGDGHATLESQRALSPQELRAMVAESDPIPAGHFEMILDPGAQTYLLRFLLDQDGSD